MTTANITNTDTKSKAFNKHTLNFQLFKIIINS